MLQLEGKVFGQYTVLYELPKRSGQRHWLCLCTCGNEASVMQGNLRSGKSYRCKDCGYASTHVCVKREAHELYDTWKNMRQRCNNPEAHNYHNYGGRCIHISSKWNDFWMFVEDMGERPKGCSLDRIDNNLGYSKENCRWATKQEQALNTRRSIRVKFEDAWYTEKELATLLGVARTTIQQRKEGGLYEFKHLY